MLSDKMRSGELQIPRIQKKCFLQGELCLPMFPVIFLCLKECLVCYGTALVLGQGCYLHAQCCLVGPDPALKATASVLASYVTINSCPMRFQCDSQSNSFPNLDPTKK